MSCRRLATVCALLLMALVTLAPAQAQCFLNDNLDGPCCEPTDLRVPDFPTTTVRTKFICWDNCDPRLSGPVLATLTPTRVACGIYLLRVSITNLSGGLTAWSGTLVMTYSRTFAESTNNDIPNLQVWRFVVNGDLRPSPELVDLFGDNRCVVPPCFFDFNNFHVKGYIDYALDCDNGDFSIAYALDHDCDVFEHENAFSVRPGTYHPGISYTWVGPEAGFDCNPELLPAQGALRCEAFRNFDFTQPLNAICQYEQPLEGGQIGSQEPICPCGDPTTAGTKQYTPQDFGAATICGSSASSVPVDVWPALLAKSIGMWTDPTVYPGVESLHLEQGMTQYLDGCSGNEARPFFYGVQTQGGYLTFKITVGPNGQLILPTSNQLIDLGNATLPPLAGAPHIGARSVPDRMIYLNVESF